jgi:hypothetical protein
MTDSSNPTLPEDPNSPDAPATDPPTGGGAGGESLAPESSADLDAPAVADTDPPTGGGAGG